MARQILVPTERLSNGGTGLYAFDTLILVIELDATRVFVHCRGCVTPDILGRLAEVKLERVPGFNNLRYSYSFLYIYIERVHDYDMHIEDLKTKGRFGWQLACIG